MWIQKSVLEQISSFPIHLGLGLGFNLNSTSQPKGRFYTRINEQDYFGITIWSGKSDPSTEVIVVQLRRRDGDNWETVGRLAVYRTSDGVYSKLPERR